MNILEQILGGGDGGANVISQIAQKFGLDPQHATAAIASLVPALGGGLQRNAAAPGGLDQLLEALQGGNHQRYVDDPSTLALPETTEDGNSILGHVFGSKEVSRQVAQQAAANSGVGADVLKKMLPIVAGLVMGYLAKKHASPAPAGASAEASQPTDLLGSLMGFLRGGSGATGEAGDPLAMVKNLL